MCGLTRARSVDVGRSPTRPALPLVRFVGRRDTYGKAPGDSRQRAGVRRVVLDRADDAARSGSRLVAQDPAFQAQLPTRWAGVPPGRPVDEALAAVSQGAGIASILGVLGLLWGVSQFYATLDLAFSRIFSDAPERDFARRTLRGFVWVLLLIGGVLVVIILAGLS
jgi:hypothetical protein